MSSLKKVRKGFTLIELLVVIAIIAMLIALLVPAVQKVREAAARAQCSNNLKQLALAVHSYHDANNRFPTGGVNNNKESWGWGAYILPYIEQGTLHDQLGVTTQKLNKVGVTPALYPLTQIPIATFRCPMDDYEPLNVDLDFNGGSFPTGHFVAKSNYMATAGGGDPGYTDNNGVLYLDSATAFRHILDGTSNTFLLGERDTRCKAGAWIGNRNPGGKGNAGTLYTLGRISVPLNDADNTQACNEAFSSKHSGGANFAFADGTVRFISESINFNNGGCFSGNNPTVDCANYPGVGTYQRLGIRDDGQPIHGEF